MKMNTMKKCSTHQSSVEGDRRVQAPRCLYTHRHGRPTQTFFSRLLIGFGWSIEAEATTGGARSWRVCHRSSSAVQERSQIIQSMSLWHFFGLSKFTHQSSWSNETSILYWYRGVLEQQGYVSLTETPSLFKVSIEGYPVELSWWGDIQWGRKLGLVDVIEGCIINGSFCILYNDDYCKWIMLHGFGYRIDQGIIRNPPFWRLRNSVGWNKTFPDVYTGYLRRS